MIWYPVRSFSLACKCTKTGIGAVRGLESVLTRKEVPVLYLYLMATQKHISVRTSMQMIPKVYIQVQQVVVLALCTFSSSCWIGKHRGPFLAVLLHSKFF